jgi:hypothetical protein
MATLFPTTFSRRALIPILVYVALWFVVGFHPLLGSDLDVVFWPAAQTVLAGHPFLVYAHQVVIHAATGTQTFRNDLGPLGLYPLVLVAWILRIIGQSNSVALLHAFAYATYAILSLLFAREAIMAIERLRGRALQNSRLAAYLAFTMSVPVWVSLVSGHIEQPLEIWLLLLAFRYFDSGLLMRAGFVFGLAVLTRSSSALLAIPLVFAIGLSLRPLLRFFGVTALTGVIVLLPFYLADPKNLVASLFTWHSSLAAHGGSIWFVVKSTPLATIAQHWDVVCIATLSALLCGYLATRPLGFTPVRRYAAFALTTVAFLLLVKTVWPYYFLETFVFASIFFFAIYRSNISRYVLVLPPLVFSALNILGELGLGAPDPAFTYFEAIAMFLCLLILIAVITRFAVRDEGLRRRPIAQIGAEEQGRSASYTDTDQ